MGEHLKITVVAGLCDLTFHAGTSTGPDDDTRPGIGFDGFASFATVEGAPAISGKIHFGRGVIGRKDATKLRDLLEIFLKDHAGGRT